jgi:hypothetical protein
VLVGDWLLMLELVGKGFMPVTVVLVLMLQILVLLGRGLLVLVALL